MCYYLSCYVSMLNYDILQRFKRCWLNDRVRASRLYQNLLQQSSALWTRLNPQNTHTIYLPDFIDTISPGPAVFRGTRIFTPRRGIRRLPLNLSIAAEKKRGIAVFATFIHNLSFFRLIFTGRQRSCKPCTSYRRKAVRPSVCPSHAGTE